VTLSVSSAPAGPEPAVGAGARAPAAAATTGYLAEVEALRGVAILLVFLYHCDTVVRPEALGGGPLFAFVRAGHTGVSLFFVLSGFLLSQAYLVEAAGGRRVRRREYFLRRAMRILPPYWLAVLVSLWWLHPVSDWPAVSWSFWGFLNPLFAPPYALWPFSIGWWSLATEVQFYVVLPLLPLAARTGPRTAAALGAYVVLYVLFVLAIVQPPGVGLTVFFQTNVFGRGWLFLSGIIAAWVWRFHGAALRERFARSRWLSLGGSEALLLLPLAALSLLLQWVAWVGFWTAENRPNHVWHLAEGPLWASILLLVLLLPLRTRWLLVNPALGAVGLVSYSLFLCHVPIVSVVLHVLQWRMPGHFTTWNAESLLACGGLLVGCLLVSTLTYWMVERPFLVRKATLAR
jgi:peptidoglycan/LPS O-acetylase OafA/YrhL